MKFYTDGSAHPNPGPGGFGVVILNDEDKLVGAYSKQINDTTNNREELKSILWVMLKYGCNITEWGRPPIVYSDSAYCVNTFNEWMFNWAKNGWLKSNNQPPENLDLIQTYYDYYQLGYRIDLRKVKGHANNKWNELADKLATGKIKSEEVYDNEQLWC